MKNIVRKIQKIILQIQKLNLKMQKLNLKMRKLNLPGTLWRGLAAQCAQKKALYVYVMFSKRIHMYPLMRYELRCLKDELRTPKILNF